MAETFSLNWIIDKLIFVLSIAASVLVIIWRINKQHKNSLELQRQNKIAELKLEIYKDIADKIQKSLDDFIPIATRIHYSIPSLLKSNRRLRDKSLEIGKELILHKIEERGETLSHDFHNAVMKLNSIISTMEKYEIAIPNFTSIRRGILENLREIMKIFSEYHSKVVDYLPIDVPENKQKELGKVIYSEPPSDENIIEINKTVENFLNIEMALLAFIHDLRIEAQNYLLSSLFPNKIPPRQPKDARYEVLSIDLKPFENLKNDVEHH